MKELKVCVYAISKNEMKNVDRWYASMSKADLVCVLDTGSTDGTPDRLEELGAKVCRTNPKNFRFDEARNASVDFSQGECQKADPDAEWIFACTDIDEAWRFGDWCDILKKYWIPGVHNRADYYYTNHYDTEHGALNWIHGYGWRWKFPCHELIYRPEGNDFWYTVDECLNLKQYGVDLVHYKDMSKSRSSYLPLLRIRYEENPNDASAVAYLLRELMYIHAWDEILEMEDKVTFDGDAAATCFMAIGDAYAGKGDYDRACATYLKASSYFPAFREPYVKFADAKIKAGKAQEALPIMEAALDTTSHVTMTQWPDSPDLFTWRYYDWMGVAAYWAGDALKALEYHAKALHADPQNASVKRNLKCAWQLWRDQERK